MEGGGAPRSAVERRSAVETSSLTAACSRQPTTAKTPKGTKTNVSESTSSALCSASSWASCARVMPVTEPMAAQPTAETASTISEYRLRYRSVSNGLRYTLTISRYMSSRHACAASSKAVVPSSSQTSSLKRPRLGCQPTSGPTSYIIIPIRHADTALSHTAARAISQPGVRRTRGSAWYSARSSSEHASEMELTTTRSARTASEKVAGTEVDAAWSLCAISTRRGGSGTPEVGSVPYV